MANDTLITLIGNLTADPEMRFTPSGAAVANFTVASTSRMFDKNTNEWVEGDTLFIRCAAWRQLAENIAESLTKGQQVIVQGPLKVRQYETSDGTKGTSVEMTVNEIGASLRFATAKMTKAQRGASGGGSGQRQQPQGQSDPWGSQPQGGGGGGWGGSSQEEPPF